MQKGMLGVSCSVDPGEGFGLSNFYLDFCSVLVKRGRLNIHCVGTYYSNCILILSIYFAGTPSSLVLILYISIYLGIKGEQFFYVLRTNWCTTICITCPILHKIECNKFVCNKFVLVLLQVAIIQSCFFFTKKNHFEKK